MNTIAIVRELADERSLTFFKLSQMCDVSHSTLKNSERRGGQLSVDTISGSAMGWASPCRSSLRERAHDSLFDFNGTPRCQIG